MDYTDYTIYTDRAWGDRPKQGRQRRATGAQFLCKNAGFVEGDPYTLAFSLGALPRPVFKDALGSGWAT